MKIKKATGRKVVGLDSAQTVGKVSRFVVDVPSRSIVALQLRKTEHGEMLAWKDISGFGDDAITVARADVFTEPDERMKTLAGKDFQLVGKDALSTAGDLLGPIKDVEFDPTSGELTHIHLKDSTLDADALVGIGSYAAVLRAD